MSAWLSKGSIIKTHDWALDSEGVRRGELAPAPVPGDDVGHPRGAAEREKRRNDDASVLRVSFHSAQPFEQPMDLLVARAPRPGFRAWRANGSMLSVTIHAPALCRRHQAGRAWRFAEKAGCNDGARKEICRRPFVSGRYSSGVRTLERGADWRFTRSVRLESAYTPASVSSGRAASWCTTSRRLQAQTAVTSGSGNFQLGLEESLEGLCDT